MNIKTFIWCLALTLGILTLLACMTPATPVLITFGTGAVIKLTAFDYAYVLGCTMFTTSLLVGAIPYFISRRKNAS